MSSIQFGGVVSGLNTQSIIDAMVAVEKQPLTAMQNQESDLKSQSDSYTRIGNALDDLVAKIKAFTVTNAGSSRAATSTDDSVLTATASPGAAVASYQISVDRLATSTRAASTSAIGAAVTGAVDTSLTLNNAYLAAPITAGNMAVNVDGTMIQVAIGDPASATLQDVMDSLSSALQAQLQTTDAGSTVTASIVGGQLQLSIAGNTVAHDISFGDVADTSNAATALGLNTQSVTAGLNATVNGTAYLDRTLTSLNLPGSITAGQVSAVIDGTLVHYTIGDPTTTTMDQIMAGLGKAITDQLAAGGANKGADASAVVTASIVDNRFQLAMSGGALTHSISFGAASDASNALGILGIANNTVTNATNPTLTGTTNLGVARTLGSMESAGLTGLTSTTTGVLTINGVDISYDTTADSLSSVITRINNSTAGVTASLDRTNDQILLSRKDTGAIAIDITDKSGTLAAALKLAPGTTNAQTIGLTSQVTVDGRVITNTSNTIAGAIDGLTLRLGAKDTLGQVETLTIGADQTAVQNALTAFVASFNSVGDMLDSATQTTPGTSGGTAGSASPLAHDPQAKMMFLALRETVFKTLGSGTLNSLGSLGLSTGAAGAAVGTTNRLQLDTDKLSAALTADPNAVARLLDQSTGPMGALLTQVKGYDDPSSTSSYIQAHVSGIATEITSLHSREAQRQTMIDDYTRIIEARFTAMEKTLSLLQSQSDQIAAQLGYSTSSSGTGTSNASSSSS
ncbi:MAG TPA: flagellar filament capping protein FliD [Candidatus Limnocylindrales bacterium]